MKNVRLPLRLPAIQSTVPSGNLTQLWKITMLLMGKSTINGYVQQLFVCLPWGKCFIEITPWPKFTKNAAEGRTKAIGTTTHLDGLLESTRIEAAVLGAKKIDDCLVTWKEHMLTKIGLKIGSSSKTFRKDAADPQQQRPMLTAFARKRYQMLPSGKLT